MNNTNYPISQYKQAYAKFKKEVEDKATLKFTKEGIRISVPKEAILQQAPKEVKKQIKPKKQKQIKGQSKLKF